jgi:alanine-glyoxylate transaminase/serine-glyoxylate transaminase/serine-pyruvate transaminase
MTAIYYPEGIQPADLLQKVASHNVVIAGGLHRAIATKYFRIGYVLYCHTITYLFIFNN